MILRKRPTISACLLRFVLVTFLVINASLQSLGSIEQKHSSPFKKGEKTALLGRGVNHSLNIQIDFMLLDIEYSDALLSMNFFNQKIDSTNFFSPNHILKIYNDPLNARAPPSCLV